MTIEEKLKKRLKQDGLTIEDLTPEQLEAAREEMKERLNIERKGGILADGFFSSMEYIGLVFRKSCERNIKTKKQQ